MLLTNFLIISLSMTIYHHAAAPNLSTMQYFLIPALIPWLQIDENTDVRELGKEMDHEDEAGAEVKWGKKRNQAYFLTCYWRVTNRDY